MSYTTPDLEGTNENYRVLNHATVIWKKNQKFQFRGTVHADSIELTKLGTVNKPLIKDIGWRIDEDDIDEKAMGDMMLKDSTFNKTLVKSVTIVEPFVGPYRLFAAYQRLFPVMGKVALFNDEPIEETPDLTAYLLRQTAYFELITSPIKDSQGNPITATNPLGLEDDPHLERPENFIKGEVHEMDVPGGKKYLHPLGGAYHAGTLVITNLNTGDKMVRGVDYDYFWPNLYKSELSSHRPEPGQEDKPGVYEFVLFLKAFTGRVSIDYHAYGGDVTLYDQRALMETMNNVIEFITQNQFVTYDNLKSAPIIANLWGKYNDLEAKMRILLSGRPTGADSTNGDAMKKRIMANDTDLHWYNIATLYKVDQVGGNDEVIVADTMKLRIKTNYTGFMFDVVVAYNKLAPNAKMDVRVLSEIFPSGYIPFEDYTGLNQLIRPQLRIIWNVNEIEDSGAILQIGFPLKGVAEEILGIEDWSGTQSCWKLAKPENPDLTYGPDDDVVTLPSGNHLWDTTNPDSRMESTIVPFKRGSIIWAGSLPLNVSAKNATFNNIEHLLEPSVDISKLTEVQIDLAEDGPNRYCVRAPFLPGSENLIASGTYSYNSKLAYINVNIVKTSEGKYRMDVESSIEAGISANPLYMRHIHIFA